MQFLKFLRGKRQQRTASENVGSASVGEAHPLEIQGRVACHTHNDDARFYQTLHGSATHKKCACNIQHKYPKKLDIQSCSSHGFHTSFGDHLNFNKLAASFPCINGISTITTSRDHSTKQMTAPGLLKNHTKWSLAGAKSDGISYHVEDNAEKEIEDMDLHRENKQRPKNLHNCQVVQKLAQCSSSSSSNSVWPLGCHQCSTVQLHPAAATTASNYRLKKNITCFVKTLFRWRSPAPVVSEDGELSARFAKLFCCDNNKTTTPRKRQLSSSDRKELQEDPERRVSKVSDPVADHDSTGEHPKNASQVLQQISCSSNHRSMMKQSRTFPAPVGSKFEYWINTDSDYVVLVVSGTTNL